MSAPYATRGRGHEAIAGLEDFYQTSLSGLFDETNAGYQGGDRRPAEVYSQSVFLEQKVDWNATRTTLAT